MAFGKTVGPLGIRPLRSAGETHYAYIEDAGTDQLATGAGSLSSVTVGVAGTLITFYDAAAADSLNTANTLMVIDTASIVNPVKFMGPPLVFSKGLRFTTTGAGTKLTVGFTGRASYPTAHTYPA